MIHQLTNDIATRCVVLTLWHWVITAMMVAGLLAGCTEIDQRAVPPGLPRRDPATPERTGTDTAVPSSPGLLSSPGPTLPDPQRIYFAHDGNLWQLPVDNLAAPVVTGHDILAFAPAPDGEQVAVVVRAQAARSAGTDEFQIVNADGTVVLRVPIPATATANVVDGVSSVAWAPNGQSIAIARQDGSISVVGIDGSRRVLVPPQTGSHPGRLLWSPDGETLAYLDPALPDQPTALHIVSVSTGERDELVAASENRMVLGVTWLPRRATLAYIRTSATTIDQGGNIFTVDPATGESTLLVSAGQFAPVSGVVDLAASPDGRYLAFSVFIPGEAEPLFQSLWVRDLTTQALIEVPTPRGEAVTDLWWASGQLIFRTIDASQATLTGVYTGIEPFTLSQFDPTTEISTKRYRHPDG